MRTVFLDTNIVLDLLDSYRPAHDLAKELMKESIESGDCITVSEDMLSTIYYIIKDKQAVLGFIQWIQINWLIVPFGKNVIQQAVELCQQRPEQDFEDALQCYCAKENGCSLLITNDAGFVGCGINVISIKRISETMALRKVLA